MSKGELIKDNSIIFAMICFIMASMNLGAGLFFIINSKSWLSIIPVILNFGIAGFSFFLSFVFLNYLKEVNKKE